MYLSCVAFVVCIIYTHLALYHEGYNILVTCAHKKDTFDSHFLWFVTLNIQLKDIGKGPESFVLSNGGSPLFSPNLIWHFFLKILKHRKTTHATLVLFDMEDTVRTFKVGLVTFTRLALVCYWLFSMQRSSNFKFGRTWNYTYKSCIAVCLSSYCIKAQLTQFNTVKMVSMFPYGLVVTYVFWGELELEDLAFYKIVFLCFSNCRKIAKTD